MKSINLASTPPSFNEKSLNIPSWAVFAACWEIPKMGRTIQEQSKTEHFPSNCLQPLPAQGTKQYGLLLTKWFLQDSWKEWWRRWRDSSFRCQLQPYSSLWIPNLFLKVNLTYLINNVQLSNVASVSKRDGNIPDMKPFISDSVMQPQTTPVSIKYSYPDTQTEGASTSGSTAAMLFPCCICSGSQKGAQSLPNCHYRPLDKWKFTF